MKLYQSPTSPFVRIVRGCALAKGLEDKIELHDRTDDGIETINPLNKVPALVTDDGETLIESRLICQYLDGLGVGPKLYSDDSATRRRILQREAIIQGMMDAVVLRRMETRRETERSAWWETRQQRKIDHVLALIEADVDGFTAKGTILPIVLGCALDFMDKHADAVKELDWRTGHPRLANWFDTYRTGPEMTGTQPKKGI